MNSERWKKVKALFDAVVELEPRERNRFLDKSCGTDEDLRRDVERLLASSDEAESFMEAPAIGEVADVIEGNGKKLERGEYFGHYEIIQQIGAGGMGEVYLAKDNKLDRHVAIKILNEQLSRNESNLARFIREAKAASGLNHPNILVIHEIGENENSSYIVSEFIEGRTLREIIEASPMKLSEILDIAIQVASALSIAHQAKIVHRDIKPENIMLRPDGYVKILDFGLAKLVEQKAIGLEASTVKQNQTAKGVILGTINYMSPEQAKSEKIDARTDIFSFGVLLYEMIAGRTPFTGDSMSETLANLITTEPLPLARYTSNVPDELQRIVSKMLRKHCDERYQTMKGLLADLKSLQRRLDFESELGQRKSPEQTAETRTQTFDNEAKPINEVSEKSTAMLSPATTDAEKTSNTETKTDGGPTLRDKPKSSRTLLIRLVLGLLLVAALGLGYWFYVNRSSATSSKSAPIESIAVLPFTNTGNDPNAEYLSDGISGSLINSLSQLPQLKVIAQSSTFKYKGKEIDPQEVANALGVQAIVMGRIARLGDNLQISVELVNARNNTQMWGEQYNRKAADLQAVQGEIARAISEKLRVRLTGAQEQQLAKRATENPEAYQLFLNGEFYFRKGLVEDERKALDYYTQAIALDPNFALAYVRLADEYEDFASASLSDPKDALAKAKEAVQKALELDDTLAQAHATRGIIKVDEWDWEGAESEFKRALDLNPNLARAHLLYKAYLTVMGRHLEALAQIKLAQELDPLNMHAKLQEGFALYNAHRFDEAISQLQRMIELQPDFSFAHYLLGTSYAMKGMYPEAIVEYQKFSSLEGETTENQIYLGYSYAMSGQREKALAILNKVKTTKEYVSPAELAILYTGLGDKEGAFQELERAYGAHDLQMQYLKVEPHYDSLRSDPRFNDLMRRVGLPL